MRARAVDGTVIGTGSGLQKNAARDEAARQGLEVLQAQDNAQDNPAA